MKTVIISMIGVVIVALDAVGPVQAAVDASKLPPAVDKKGVTFEKDIKPIFQKSCVKCHGPEKQKGPQDNPRSRKPAALELANPA